MSTETFISLAEHEGKQLLLLKSFERSNNLMAVLVGRAIDSIEAENIYTGIDLLRKVQAILAINSKDDEPT